MKLDGLVSLYKSMKTQGFDRQRFEYKCNKACFDVFFFIDSSPYLLLFGAKGENFCFEATVEKGFLINPHLDKDTYKRLCEVLGLEYDPERHFKPSAFFSEFNGKIPKTASIKQKVQSHHIAPYRQIDEEPDKIYYLRWQDNTLCGKNVTPENLEKTRLLLGERYCLRSKEKNFSSCWSADKDKAKEPTMP